MTTKKRKISVSLDADLVEELQRERGDEALSSLINDAVRSAVEQNRRNRQMRRFLDEMEAEYGAPPEELVQYYMDLLR